jgi:cholesterol transport system auxiliary component
MIKTATLLGIALALGGCVKIGGGKPPASLLNLTSAVRVAADDARMAHAGETITIGVPGVPQAIATNRVAVNDGDTSIAYVKDAQWVEPPARLFQRLLSETVAAKTGKMVLDPRQFAVEPGTQLAGQLRQFGIDASRSEAVIVYDAALMRDHGKQISTRRFEARIGVGVIAAGPAGTALNRAANQIAGAVADWIVGQK